MKQYNVRMKMLTYGFPPLKNEFKFECYTLKRESINELDVSDITKKFNFSTANYIYFCSFKDDNENNCYSYFENEELIQVKIKSNTDDRDRILHNIIYNKGLVPRIYSLEKKLRLKFNIRILLPITVIEVYNEAEESFGKFIYYKTIPNDFGIKFDDIKTFESNYRVFLNMSSLDDFEKKNFKFQKAMKYYYISFESNDTSLRFVNLFSALEALLIYDKDNKKDIAEHLAVRISRLLFYHIDNQKELYDKIKELYDERSKYLHGSKLNDITTEKEKELRKIVRYVLIVYWIHVYSTGLGSTKILTKLDNNEKVDMQTQLVSKYIMSDDYATSYKECCEQLAVEIEKGDCKATSVINGIIKSVEEVIRKE